MFYEGLPCITVLYSHFMPTGIGFLENTVSTEFSMDDLQQRLFKKKLNRF